MFLQYPKSVRSLANKSLSRRCLSLVGYDNDSVTVELSNGSRPTFSTLFLRDSCTATKSVDPLSKQKLFTTAEISSGLKIHEPPEILDNSRGQVLQVKWLENDGTILESTYQESFLINHSRNDVVHQNSIFNRREWNRDILEGKIDSLQLDYSEYFQPSTFGKVVDDLNMYGLSFVNNIPDPIQNQETQAINPFNELKWPVAKLASQFGYIKKTFYGTLFDVKNEKQDAKNIANTNTFLPLHMDLLYYESPPGLQLLHFIRNSTEGGENVFADSFAAALYVRKNDPEAYEALKIVPVTYHYNNNNEYYYYARPVIVEEPYSKDPSTGESLLKEVNYSPPFQGPLQLSTISDANKHLLNDFIRGFTLFEQFIKDPKNQYLVKMKEGSCVLFDNRRTLHSRLQFSDEVGGDRWLMGCYVDGDSFRSKMRMTQCLNLNP